MLAMAVVLLVYVAHLEGVVALVLPWGRFPLKHLLCDLLGYNLRLLDMLRNRYLLRDLGD